MSCRVGLLRLHRAGLIALPAPRNGNGNGQALQPRCDDLPEPVTLSGSVQALAGLRLEAVVGAAESRLWNALIARWHYLGYTPLSGAQLRDLIRRDGGVLGALGFGAAAWNIEAINKKLTERRDTADVTELLKELHRIVNQAIRAEAPGDDQIEGLTYFYFVRLDLAATS
ncbi:MAG: DUF4338 domain-containing protein [Thiocapsa sp.]|nr:Druantia anti-phage system protein DruA [Thiocapsa sp.]QVL51397.1 MAG: DUF4338 domain-containing protein [Thiocapsa sp.]